MEVEDHWPIPLLGGLCRLIEENGLITGIEFTKNGVPKELAFSVVETPDGPSKATITGNDSLLPQVRDHLIRAFAFLQCYFDTEISVDVVSVTHEAETAEEEAHIVMPAFNFGKKEQLLRLPYDMFTRSLMVAAEQEPPTFVSTLATQARQSLIDRRYIDSFRFSFLLIESLFGGGKFKANQLKKQLASAAPLIGAIGAALAEWKPHPSMTQSPSLRLINSTPAPETIAEHLVDMRGHYFHGNLVKPGAWHPAQQEEANALASFAVSIVQVIAAEAATPLFDEKYSALHFKQAGEAGAHVKMEVTYLYRLPGDGDLLREDKVVVNSPGTKPTTPMAMNVAWRSVRQFTDGLPVGRLHSVSARNLADGSQVFSIRFFTEEDSPANPLVAT